MSIKININDLKAMVAQLDNAPDIPEGKKYGAAVRTSDGIVEALIDSAGLVTINQDGAL